MGDMEKKRSSRLLPVAIVVFVIGLIALIALFVMPAVADGETAPTAVYLLALCAPLGFLLAIAAALRTGRRTR